MNKSYQSGDQGQRFPQKTLRWKLIQVSSWKNSATEKLPVLFLGEMKFMKFGELFFFCNL